jgi:hypothetical protein
MAENFMGGYLRSRDTQNIFGLIKNDEKPPTRKMTDRSFFAPIGASDGQKRPICGKKSWRFVNSIGTIEHETHR